MDRARPRRSLKIQYLILFNLISALLWTAVLLRTTILLPLVGSRYLYGGVGTFAQWTQTLATLEVVHVLTGLLRSSLPTTTVQVASRLLLVWGVCGHFEAPRESNAYACMLLAWSVTEIVRYTYYVSTFVRYAGSEGVLGWLRYNTFWILYPLGAGSEAWCIFRALPEAGREDYRLYWVFVAILGIYAPGLYNQYTHMIRQRRKQMRGKKVA